MRSERARSAGTQVLASIAGILLMTVGVRPAVAQEADPASDSTAAETPASDSVSGRVPGPAGQDSVAGRAEAVEYQREVFDYPAFDRRDPFRPRVGGTTEGPRFENLVLSGVIYNPTVGSVAVLVDRATGRRHRVREGQRLGQLRIDAIDRAEVEVLVPGPGGRERRVLRVEKQREESEG